MTYTDKYKAELVLEFAASDYNHATLRRRIRLKTGNRFEQIPDEKVIRGWLKKFLATGSVSDQVEERQQRAGVQNANSVSDPGEEQRKADVQHADPISDRVEEQQQADVQDANSGSNHAEEQKQDGVQDANSVSDQVEEQQQDGVQDSNSVSDQVEEQKQADVPETVDIVPGMAELRINSDRVENEPLDTGLTPMPMRRAPARPLRRIIFSDEDRSDNDDAEHLERLKSVSRRRKPKKAVKKPTASKKATSSRKDKSSKSSSGSDSDGSAHAKEESETPASATRSKTKKGKTQKPTELTLLLDEMEGKASSVEPPETSATVAKTPRKIWTAKAKRDLQMAFQLINPCSDGDWEKVAEHLAYKWTIDELKTQSQKMRLKPIPVVQKPQTPSNTAVEKIRKLIPDGKLPQKGTIRREALEEELMQTLFARKTEDASENALGSNSLDDSDDILLREAMQNHALNDNLLQDNANRYTTPSKRVFFPKAVSACRRRSSIAMMATIGDDFSLPDTSKQIQYRNRFRAQQFNSRLGATRKRSDNDSAEFTTHMSTLREEEDDDEENLQEENSVEVSN